MAASTLNIIFVHGAFQGGWVWDKIRPAIIAAGYTAYFPTLKGLAKRANELTPQLSLEDHVNEICDLIDTHSLNNVVLIGHSYGGMVITGVTGRKAERITALVYLDALTPDNQESALDILGHDAKQGFFLAAENGEGWRIDPFTPENFGITKLHDIKWAVPQHTAQSLKTFTDKVTALSKNELKHIHKIFIHCTKSSPIMNILADKARTNGWLCRKIATPHCPMISHPQLTIKELSLILSKLYT